jgi:hypothetical protein
MAAMAQDEMGVAFVTRRGKWLASVGLVAALGAGTAGAFVTSASARPRHPHPAPVVTPTAPVTTATFNFTAAISGISKNLGTVTLTGFGQADFVNDAVALSVTLPASVAQLIPGGSASPEVVHVVLSGGTVYVEVPALATLLGAPWISLSLPPSAVASVPGIFTDVAGALGNVNQILAFARAHHAHVRSLGASNVDGTSVTGSGVTARLKGLRLTATLWADSSDRLVQAIVSAKAGHRGLGISATVNFSDYGAPVTISVPPPSQVRAIPLSVVTQVLGSLLNNVHLGGFGTKIH